MYAQLFVEFGINITSMAPPQTKVIVYNKPNKCAAWSNHGVAGWYIGPELEHYRCYQIFLNDTRSERIANIADFSTECENDQNLF